MVIFSTGGGGLVETSSFTNTISGGGLANALGFLPLFGLVLFVSVI
jgi:hypothetical protein